MQTIYIDIDWLPQNDHEFDMDKSIAGSAKIRI